MAEEEFVANHSDKEETDVMMVHADLVRATMTLSAIANLAEVTNASLDVAAWADAVRDRSPCFFDQL